MQVTADRSQNARNRRRLIQQNLKLQLQVHKIKEQIDHWSNQDQLHDQSLPNSHITPIVGQINGQEKLMRKLKGQIQKYKLERAKDNVEYIVREEDELRVLRRQELKLMDEKQIYLNKREDKSWYLKKEEPYQNYQRGFLQRLNQVVKFNRQQASSITQIERDIRKYHMIQKSHSSPVGKILSPEAVGILEGQINVKIEGRKALESQWKPHFKQLDQQYAHLLHDALKRKQTVTELEREEKNWETRVSAIREADKVVGDKNRIGSVKVSTKLRQKIIDFIEKEEEKTKKKVNQEDLKYQFTAPVVEETRVEEGKQSNGPPPLPGQKKKQDKVMETFHNDKNITKKIEKGGSSPKKITKVSQNVNTQVSIPSNNNQKEGKSQKAKKKTLVMEVDLEDVEKSKPKVDESRDIRLWQQSKEVESAVRKESIKSTPKNQQVSRNGYIQMREIGTEAGPLSQLRL